ncbi:7048_t:CDS:1, partial [Ambispora leptoticha]
AAIGQMSNWLCLRFYWTLSNENSATKLRFFSQQISEPCFAAIILGFGQEFFEETSV